MRCGTCPFSIYLGEYADETAEAVHWHVPRTHEYEAWSDVRAFDGTITIQQPQMRPRGERHSAHELLALFSGQTAPDGRAIVREHWQARAQDAAIPNFDAYWMDALRVGIVREQRCPTDRGPATCRSRALAGAIRRCGGSPPPKSSRLLFRPDIYLWDGRFADNGWLQEMGRPFTRLTWDNAALVSPRTAQRLGLATADIVEVGLGGRRVRAPVWVLPGQADDCVTLPLGYGRRRTGPVGEGVGFNAFALRTRATALAGARVPSCESSKAATRSR